ncbi:MAG: RluA family pseudouridine synthase [Synechococcus sp. MED-G133]|uniref:RluA family pseudouridine synthase n=1 Tax=Synechococcus sp. A15-28 TaxID=1050638 RepID=UPI0012265116|nr:RluA family pseudouridine synthase [Synechococcus sp. A15-28]QNI41805.1 ribosomal large subunit pseudouridine synthase A [Synechococcus sp. A15-28]RZO08839.1 MAG: RluA family pseudouridine synthase [Synechococcus sp. MED-G133]
MRSGSSPEDPTILYGDPWLLVVLKPSGLLSQPGRGDHLQDSLITRLQRLRGEHHLVHRLDRDTSGVVLVARCLDSLRRCSALFAARRVNKLYEAEVEGQLHGRGRIDSRLARLDRDPPRYGDHPQGRPSTTLWRVRARQEDSTKLWLRPLTGRSHQLRAHLAGIGHPILGDPIYGEGSMTPLRLHARALGFQHPFTGRRLRVFTRQDDDNHAG